VLRSAHSTVMKIRSIWPRTNGTYTHDSENTNDGVGTLKLLHTLRGRSRAVAAPSTRSKSTNFHVRELVGAGAGAL